jgi:hypothetical protein
MRSLRSSGSVGGVVRPPGRTALSRKQSWEDSQKFISKVNDSNALPKGWKMALPTEAQWEYACRAGAKGPYPDSALDALAWYKDNSGGTAQPVATKRPNAWGLYDMLGNLDEWCADWSGNESPSGVDPTGPAEGTRRVSRGFCHLSCSGSFAGIAPWIVKAKEPPYDGRGFRPVLIQVEVVEASSAVENNPALPARRVLTDKSERKMDAEIISITADNVKIRRLSDRKDFDVPLSDLSEEDQAFLKNLTNN